MAQKTITITWRNEHYGSVGESVAFRAMFEPWPSDAQKTRAQAAYKAAGFKLNINRQAWIAEWKPDDTPLKLVEKLEALGYEIIHKGAVPHILEQTPQREQSTGPRM